jgi:phosphate acetyltransferase
MERNSLDIDELAKNFLYKCRSLEKIKVAVVYPCSEDALTGPVEAAHQGIIEPVLIGPEKKIRQLADKIQIDLSSYEIIDSRDGETSAEKSVSLVHEGKAEAIMKGSLHTDELMRPVVKKENGLRTQRRISHAFVMAIENYHKPFVITDAAINISPNLLTKKDIIQNAIDLVHSLNKEIVPKVAILSAVETVNPDIPSTLDAACLCKMAERDQIVGAIVDGPFAYDNVLSLHAAQTKQIKSPVIGDADIFVVPNLEAGNMLAKQLVLITNAVSAGIILGASVPIILTSRSDGVRSRVGSCAIAMMMAHAKRQQMLEAE